MPHAYRRLVFLWCLALLLPGCIDAYVPEVINSPTRFLVVEGFINSQGQTTIYLSRSVTIDSRQPAPKETGAAISIEGEDFSRYNLQEASAGTYTSAYLALNPAQKYRLILTTSQGKAYASDFMPVQLTPAIESVTYAPKPEGLEISVNTQDERNTTHYYRWEFEETWEIAPLLRPYLEYKRGRIQDIETPYPILCWRSAKSTDVNLAKTTNLVQDRVANHLIQSIPDTSEKLHRTYSILVKQYAQTKEEYSYWELLQKNTENLGSIFDPLPVQLTGNLHGITDEQEVVLGYIGIHSVAEKRIFITPSDIPRTWRTQSGYESCAIPDTVDFIDAWKIFGGPPVSFVPVGNADGGYTFTTPACVDCRLRGTNVKPDFWP
jgi:hypothetical protein